MSKTGTARRSTSGRNEPFLIRPLPVTLEPNSEWNPFQTGTRVRCINPGGYADVVAAMVRDRVGVVSSLLSNSARPVVVFPAVGKRRAYRWVPDQPTDLQVVGRTPLKSAV